MKYRREVDGLRAVAVLPVIFFHAGFDWVSGGFVGVDVFFVISGYLITTIILNELESGQFSIVGFYERRARRILPALFLVLACCVPLAYSLLLPEQLGSFSRSLMSVLIFLSNLYFGSEVNYFARASEEEPLLHTWSLAVEEQYYLLFPLLAMLLWKSGRGVFFVTAISIALVSLLYADSQSFLKPDKAFFDTLGRVWELFVGSLLAIYLLRLRKAPSSKVISEIGSLLGLGLLAWAFLMFEQSTPFPGRFALIPTLGAALVILFTTPETYAGRLLGSRVAVGVGLISYSAYLWHQPIFAFVRLTSNTPPTSLIFSVLSLLTLGLAYLSWRFVEQPFRTRQRVGRRQIFVFWIAGFALLTAMALPGHLYDGLPARFGHGDRDLIVTYESRGDYVRARHRAYREAGSFDPRGGFKLLIIGDSFSQDLVNILYEGHLFQNAQIRARYIPARCQVYSGEAPISELVEPSSAALCSRDYYEGLDTLVAEADAVFVAASWREWSVERLPVTLERLGIAAKENYIIFGLKSLGYINRAAYVGWSVGEKATYLNSVNDASSNINRALARSLGPYHFVDKQALLCGDATATRCPIFDEKGALLSYDGAHLTRAGARYVGHRLAAVPIVSELSAIAAH